MENVVKAQSTEQKDLVVALIHVLKQQQAIALAMTPKPENLKATH